MGLPYLNQVNVYTAGTCREQVFHKVYGGSPLSTSTTSPPHYRLWPQGPGSPASLLLLHILDDGTLGEGQLILSLGLVVKESLDCTL